MKNIWNGVPSGLLNSLKVGREMTVCETEWTGSSTQVISLGWQDLIQRMMSERSTLGLLKRKRNCLIVCVNAIKQNATAHVLLCGFYRLNWWSNEQQWSTLQDYSPQFLISTIEILSKQIHWAFLKWYLHFSQSCFGDKNLNRFKQEAKNHTRKENWWSSFLLATHSFIAFLLSGWSSDTDLKPVQENIWFCEADPASYPIVLHRIYGNGEFLETLAGWLPCFSRPLQKIFLKTLFVSRNN